MWENTDDNTSKRSHNSLWQTGSREFFRDNRARRIGDILKIKIEIKDKANLNNTTATKRKSKEDLGMPNFLGLQDKISKILPGSNSKSLVSTSSANGMDGSGDIKRNEDIEIEVAAMIKQILPNGNLVISGTQEIKINYEVREVSIRGIIRAEDISSENAVRADQIAEARISYGGRGTLSRMQRPRYGSQLLDIILPW
ncbi:Flagellar L-ring protein [Rickettsia endosymbiont of Cardiosporidium cionae]|nr:Flagellar L-ring protein [Rickettsia endosymbiont of Cardiosporidium cionae]